METISTLLQTISNNNSAIADKQDEIYEYAYEAGKQAGGVNIDPDKIIEKTITGKNIVALDDVSEIPHDISVSITLESPELEDVTSNEYQYISYSKGKVQYRVVFTPEYMQTPQYQMLLDEYWYSDSEYYGGDVDFILYMGEAYEDYSGGTSWYTHIPGKPDENGVWEFSLEADNDRQDINMYWQNAEGNFTVYKLVSDVANKEVTVYGKNLVEIQPFVIATSSTRKTIDAKLIKGRTVTLSALIDATSAESQSFNLRLDYVVNGVTTYNKTNVVGAGSKEIAKVTATIPNNVEKVELIQQISSSSKVGTAQVSNVMLSVSNDVEYEPYNSAKYTTTADGKIEVKSLSPNMTFICDEMNLSVSYHKSWGMQTEYDRFWDTLQQNGTRKDYYFGFAGNCWSKETFKPKYDIQPTNASYMFAYLNISSGFFKPFDLVEHLEELGITLDFSKASSLSSTFNTNKLFTRVGVIETYSNMESTFYHATNLVTIDKIKLSNTGNQTFSTGTFTGCTKLANITFDGVIGQNISFSSCPLSRASIDNIFEHLKVIEPTWTETTETGWQVNYDSTWPMDRLIVKIDDVEQWKAYTNGNHNSYASILLNYIDSGSSEEIHFDDNGVCDISHCLSYGDLESIYITDVIIDGGFSYNVYEGTAPTPKALSLKKTAVEAAYTTAEWYVRVTEANKNGWTIELK